ncbi:DUF2793 domain-containing protein [Sphingomonas sp. LY54]|uniref:DUF2793 domain-containing protein n=1 Tax=Sphingomonas sp. LY54 TaxID=3095343 RepID=UPI002D78BEA9|nr:DUF2793 domain-containing protein [Sphingomonas sp. LY54]WRP29538.1 DUF2793 domain-containing protein [Sphingomonas sp. LY54]
MNATPRFQLPFILPGQAQKELYHNEALSRIDCALHGCVEEGPLATPPTAPTPGQSWVVAAPADGAWTGQEGHIACWTEGGWRFLSPQPGTCVWDKAARLWLHYEDGGWSDGEVPAAKLVIGGVQVVGKRQPPILSPSGGAIIDTEARAAIDALIATLMSHGLTD